MSQSSDSVFAVGSTQIVVGLSGIITVIPTPYEMSKQIKIMAGGGTLEIAPIPASAAAKLDATTARGLGYPIGLAEAVSIAGGAALYLVATGATMTATLLIGQSQGATLV